MANKIEIDESKQRDLPKRTNQLIALTVLVLTICATFSSLYAGANSRKGILAQSQATDLWSYYQAKSIKQKIYETQLSMLEVNPPDDAAKFAQLSAKYQAEIDRYEVEQREIKNDAIAKSIERDKYLSLNRGFAAALTFLQIAIMLSSLATLLRQKYFWYVSMGFGAFGLAIFLKTMLIG